MEQNSGGTFWVSNLCICKSVDLLKQILFWSLSKAFKSTYEMIFLKEIQEEVFISLFLGLHTVNFYFSSGSKSSFLNHYLSTSLFNMLLKTFPMLFSSANSLIATAPCRGCQGNLCRAPCSFM